jgi:hypothetical protein
MIKINVLLTILIAFILSACSHIQKVEPWEKGNLAKPHMILDADALDIGFTEHTYFSKEAASGGGGVGGGGCGCN